jgi:hypothetical protein
LKATNTIAHYNEGINRKQSTWWQHLSQLKVSAFFSLQIFFSCNETQQLTLGTGTAIWWVTEPSFAYCRKILIIQAMNLQLLDNQNIFSNQQASLDLPEHELC